MDTRQLKYFVSICNCGKLSHAAEQCNVASSALSHHISNLEEELETKLFTRKPRGMEPTAAGLKLLKHATQILAAMDNAVSEVKIGQTEISGRITIGIPHSVINVIGSNLMRHVLEEYPKVRLIIQEVMSGVSFNALTTNQIEIALVFNPPIDPSADRIPMLEEELFCIGHSSILGDNEEPISLDDMTKLPEMLVQSKVFSRALVDKPAILARLEDKSKIQLASVAATICALNEQLGCILAPKSLVSELLKKKMLIARPVINPKPLRKLYLVSSNFEPPTDLHEAMTKVLIDIVQAAVTSGRWDATRLISG